jgi:hypothetical protein
MPPCYRVLLLMLFVACGGAADAWAHAAGPGEATEQRLPVLPLAEVPQAHEAEAPGDTPEGAFEVGTLWNTPSVGLILRRASLPAAAWTAVPPPVPPPER